MNKFKTMRGMQLLAGAALLAVANLACAQFVWVDAKGVKQYSDMPPPASVPLNKILKQPGRMGALAAADESASKPAEETATAPKTTAERELDYRKRMKDKADADAKAAALANNQAQRQAACDAARVRGAELSTGRRMRSSTGNRAIIDDNERAQQQAAIGQTLAGC